MMVLLDPAPKGGALKRNTPQRWLCRFEPGWKKRIFLIVLV